MAKTIKKHGKTLEKVRFQEKNKPAQTGIKIDNHIFTKNATYIIINSAFNKSFYG